MRAASTYRLASSAVMSTAVLIALSGCSSTAEPAPSASAETAATATQAQTPIPEAECSGLTGLEALTTAAGTVDSSRAWDLTGEYSEVTNYDECADLSWIVLRPEECCTAFGITPVLFFNHGELVPGSTVSDRALSRDTEPVRNDDGEIALTFAYSGTFQYPVRTATTFKWDESSATVTATDGEPTSEGVDGRWCPTAESASGAECVTIAYATATSDSGATSELTNQGGTAAGGLAISVPGAPFGTFYTAGTPIVLPDYYPGADLPEQDRIWNGQTGVMLVRA